MAVIRSYQSNTCHQKVASSTHEEVVIASVTVGFPTDKADVISYVCKLV